jgi:hypothetical protein
VRVINGQAQAVKPSSQWVPLNGKIIGVTKEGVLVHGNCGNALDEEIDFFIANFPYQVAEGDYVGLDPTVLGQRAGVHKYVTVLGAIRTIHKFDYGALPGSPPARIVTPEMQAAAKAAADKKKASGDLATFKFHIEHAIAGSEASQRRLAELYAKGIGCEVDTNAAAAWLRAAATNSPSR